MNRVLIYLFCYTIIPPAFTQASKTIPNILWITCEDMSPHLSCFGEKVIETPHLDTLAKDGIMYTNVYTVSGVCAPSRHAIITGMYPTSTGGNNMRNYRPNAKQNETDENNPFPSYSVVVPDGVKCFTEYLRVQGYYCTNNSKQDYQFEAPLTAWDESSNNAHYKNRKQGQPFFAVFNLNVTHESNLWERANAPMQVDKSKIMVPPYYPDVAEVRNDMAIHFNNIKEMDRQAGQLIDELKASGEYDNTYIFFFSDHGDALPYVKREITKRGLHIPLIIKKPNSIEAGSTDSILISSVDITAAVLSIANIKPPKYMHGQAFLGKYKKGNPRKYIYAARDRMDSEVDRVRSVFDGRYQYIFNYHPELPFYQDIQYRYNIPMMQKILKMKNQKQLNEHQSRWFATKPIEELYDTYTDPHQLYNLVNNSEYIPILKRLRKEYTLWKNKTGDLHEKSENYLTRIWWNDKRQFQITSKPELIKTSKGYKIKCKTKGASIGWRKRGEVIWNIYNGNPIDVEKSDEIEIVAHKIGWEKSFNN